MNPKIFLIRMLAAGMFIALLSSCSSTQVISSWSSNNPPVGAMNKVLVLGVMANRETKDQVEQAMATELTNHGVSASPAMTVFGPQKFRKMKEDDIINKLKSSNFTSVMIVSLVDKERQKEHVPGYYTTYPYTGPGYYRFYRRYWYMYDQVYTPGYYKTTTNWVLEADIYTIDDDELIYSTQTRSYDPNNAKDLAESFAKSIVDELKSKGMVPK